jgi:transcriptional regulator with XRE-family HTH domain
MSAGTEYDQHCNADARTLARTTHTQLITQLRDARTAQGLSQLDLAVLASTHQSTIGSAESGRRPAGLITLIRLADALGYDLALIPREDA